jgi:hypothetical protein
MPWFCAAGAGWLRNASVVPRPARSYDQRPELVEVTSPRWVPCHCIEKAGNLYSASLYICRVVLLLLRQRRCAAGNGLGTAIKYLRRKTSSAAGSGPGTSIEYLRQTTSDAAMVASFGR